MTTAMLQLLATLHPCLDCGAAAGVACVELCPSASLALADRVAADLDSASSTGRCCSSPLCPCRAEVAA